MSNLESTPIASTYVNGRRHQSRVRKALIRWSKTKARSFYSVEVEHKPYFSQLKQHTESEKLDKISSSNILQNEKIITLHKSNVLNLHHRYSIKKNW